MDDYVCGEESVDEDALKHSVL
eukprot:COSAG06_NODE_54307_length_295_cov_0.795918_1_plen_21_part_10